MGSICDHNFMKEDQQEQPQQDPIPDNEEQLTETPDVPEPAESTPSLEEEMLKWRDSALRTAAEYDNYRKRMSKEREESIRYANQRLLEELLPIIDNFDMGMQMASADAQSMIYIGMDMVRKQLSEFLGNHGVTSIDAQPGQVFDHNIHEAIQSEESDQPEGSILRIIRKGYKINDRLLRPVNVVVARPHTQQQDEPQA